VQGLGPGEARLIRPARNRVNGGVAADVQLLSVPGDFGLETAFAQGGTGCLKTPFETAGLVV
jgi:hypothetical protein